MENFIIPRDMLRAMVFMAPQGNDLRKYLMGVRIEVDACGSGRIVATDGAVLGVGMFHTQRGPLSITIPTDVVSGIPKAGPKMCQLSRADEKSPWVLESTQFEPVEGRFPDYARVIPKTLTGAPNQVNMSLLDRFVKVAKALNVSSPQVKVVIGWNKSEGSSTHLVNILGRSDFVGCFMALSGPSLHDVVPAPAWATTRLDTEKKAEECSI